MASPTNDDDILEADRTCILKSLVAGCRAATEENRTQTTLPDVSNSLTGLVSAP